MNFPKFLFSFCTQTLLWYIRVPNQNLSTNPSSNIILGNQQVPVVGSSVVEFCAQILINMQYYASNALMLRLPPSPSTSTNKYFMVCVDPDQTYRMVFTAYYDRTQYSPEMSKLRDVSGVLSRYQMQFFHPFPPPSRSFCIQRKLISHWSDFLFSRCVAYNFFILTSNFCKQLIFSSHTTSKNASQSIGSSWP